VPSSVRILLALALGAVVFLAFLGRRDITTSHEARVAQTGREMAEAGWPWSAKLTGVPAPELVKTVDGLRLRSDPGNPPIWVNPWGVPLLNGQIRLQKPPLPYWVAAVMYRIAGAGEWGARFVPALMGLLCTLLMYDLARRTLGRRGAWVAAVIWVSSHFVTDEFRKAMADPYLAFFTLLCLCCWVRGGARGSPRWPLLVFYPALAFGFLAKGPVLLVHLGFAVGAFHFCLGRGLPRGVKAHLVGLALLLLIAIPWPMYVMSHVPNAVELWRYESVGKLTGENIEKSREWYSYLPQLAQLSLPWTAVWVLGLIYPFIPRGGRLRLRSFFPLVWYAATVVFFSCLTVKKAAYLLPMMPAQVLFIAQFTVAMMGMIRRQIRPLGPAIAVEAQKYIGVGIGILLAVTIAFDVGGQTKGGPTASSVAAALVHRTVPLSLQHVGWGVLAFLLGLLPLVAGRRRVALWFVMQGMCYSALLAVFYGLVAAPMDNAGSPREFARVVAAAAARPGYTLSRARLAEAVLFHLPPTAPYDPSAEHVLVVVEERPKHRLSTSELVFFKDDIPDAVPVRAVECAVPAGSPRHYWRLYDVTVERRSGPTGGR